MYRSYVLTVFIVLAVCIQHGCHAYELENPPITKDECIRRLKHTKCECFHSSIKCAPFTLNFYKSLEQIRCDTANENDYEVLPDLNLGRLPSLTFTNCPIPNKETLPKTLKRLGITEVHEIKLHNGFADTDTQIDVLDQHYENVPGLKRIGIYQFRPRLPDNYFENCSMITELSVLGENTMAATLLQPLKNLEKISILVNNMEEIGSVVFVNQKNLKLIEIDCGMFNKNDTDMMLPADAFIHQTELRIFMMRFCGTALPETLLHTASKIEHINLKTALRTLPSGFLANKQNLIILDLAFNYIDTLPNDFFKDCLKLRALYLANNRIENIPRNMFNHLRNLQVLNLEGNKLTVIDPKGFSPLRSKIFVGDQYSRILETESIKHTDAFVCKDEFFNSVCRFCNRTEYLDHFGDEEECNKATFT